MSALGSKLTPARLRYLAEAVVLLGLALAVFVPGGCSQTPVSPVVPTYNTFPLPNGVIAYPGTLLPGSDIAAVAPFTIPIRLEDTTVKEEGIWTDSVDTGGGVIALDMTGEASYFTVAPDGLDEKTEIRVSMYRYESRFFFPESTSTERITEFHFEPEGLVFKEPSQLSYQTSLKDGEKLELHYWDPDKEQWLKSADAVVVNGYATFPILHFSDYRTTERVSLGGQRGAQ